MSDGELVRILVQLPFVIIFVVTLLNAVRRPRRSTIDIALLFGALATIVLISWVVDQIEDLEGHPVSVIQSSLLLSLPYLLLRVVSDFIAVPPRLVRGAAFALMFLIVGIIVSDDPLPGWLVLAATAYFVGLMVYISWKFVEGARLGSGVTARRLFAAATGSALLGAAIALIAVGGLAGAEGNVVLTVINQTLAVAIGVAYFIAFSPPRLLRRAWQEPELRGLLARVAVLPRMPDHMTIVHELEAGAAATLGARGASIGLWDADRQVLSYRVNDNVLEVGSGFGVAGRVFKNQTPHFSENAPRDDPEYAHQYRQLDAIAVLAAPITAGTRPIGVLAVYAQRPPIFADDDLQLVELLADQAAIILESRTLIDEAAQVQARAEATRLRDDFLVAAAHDLRTPLTAALARAQFIHRRARNNPEKTIDPDAVGQIVDDLRRLASLMTELLDAARAEHGRLIDRRQQTDLVALVRECLSRHDWSHHRCVITAPEAIDAEIDPLRIAQVIDNLIENAIKYSPDGGDITIAVAADETHAHLTVTDHGIGIPPADLPNIFDRFHRAGNVDMTTAAGMGLGLFICKSIIEQHGGTIQARSTPGEGTTFDIILPLTDRPNDTSAPAAVFTNGMPAKG